MDKLTKAEHLPWLQDRMAAHTKPLYKIIARSMSLAGDSIVMLHQAGCEFVVNYNIRDIVKNSFVMANLDKKEADLLRWVVNSEITDPLKLE